MENNATNTTISSITALNSTGDALKSILLIILFFVTFLSAVTSFLIKRYALNQQRNQQSNVLIKNVFSLVSCFGAGVFLATCLLDLLSDSMDSIRRAEKRMGYELEFPLAAFCVAIGFLFVLFIEQVKIYYYNGNPVITCI
jgi:zinc transporter 1/2/3